MPNQVTDMMQQASRTERENQAFGEATSIVAKANATAEALKTVAAAIAQPVCNHVH